MKKILVGYKSVSGFTKTYAKWIAQALDADLQRAKEINARLLASYDIIIFGGSLHASGVAGLKRLSKHFAKLEDKPIIVFCTGASPADQTIIEQIKKANLPAHSQIPFFYMRGGFDFSKLDFGNKILMILFKWKLRMVREKSSDVKGMLAAYEKPMDFVKKEKINDLVSYVRSIENVS